MHLGWEPLQLSNKQHRLTETKRGLQFAQLVVQIIPSRADCGKGSQMTVVVVRHGGHVLGEADMTGLDWAQTLMNSPHLRWWWDSLTGLACTPKNLAGPRRLESWALEGAAGIR